MPPENDNETERVGAKLKSKVEELERTVKALLKAMQEAEKELGEPLMPAGVYYGTKFED